MYSALKPEGSNPQRPEQVLKIIFGLLLVLPLLVWSFSAYQTYLAVQSDAIERTRRMADLLHEHALKVFETQELVASQVEQFLFGLSDQQIIEREAALWPRFRGISDKLEQLQDIWVLDALGHPLLVTTFAQAPRNLDLSDRAYFVVHRDKLVSPGDFYLSEPLRGRADPSLIFFQLSKARIVDDVFRGVTALSVEPRYFSNFYAGVANNGFSRLLVSRVDGTVLAPVGIEVWREALDADVFAQGLERLGLESGHEGRERRFHPPHAIGAGCRPTPGRRRPPASSTRRPSFGKGASLRLEARGLVARARPPRP